MKMRDSS